ncbi:hypothetical protein [Fodinicola feengrottensis]|uniref:hypothetical protein n=1 Tax=Fodinicola feengrottensis TaxID=435914 RepID=UPI0024431FDA|nr:hypothetical protein [Fodinicola feengrottensis]
MPTLPRDCPKWTLSWAALGSDSDRLAREERAIPLDAERNLTNAVARHADRARRTGTCRVDLSVEQRRHDDLLTKRDRAWGRFAEYASDHGFGLRNLDEQATALREFERGLASLLGRIAVLEAKREALSTAEVTLSQRREELEVAAVEESEVDLQLRDATVRLQTARNALGSDQRQQLQRRDDLDKILAELEKKNSSKHSTTSGTRPVSPQIRRRCSWTGMSTAVRTRNVSGTARWTRCGRW